MERSYDGLTAEMLRASRATWWDDSYTRALLDTIPTDALRVIDVGSGQGQAARTILPARGGTVWIGVDPDGLRVAQAQRSISEDGLAGRCAFVRGVAEALPFASGAFDAALFGSSLAQTMEPLRPLAEAKRVLGASGRLVVTEPDPFAQHVYLDGRLEAVDAELRALHGRADASRKPRQYAVGPRLPSLLCEAGFDVLSIRVHVVQRVDWGTAAEWLAVRIQDIHDLARHASLDLSAPELTSCEQALQRAAASSPPDRILCGIHTAPVFIVVGVPRAG